MATGATAVTVERVVVAGTGTPSAVGRPHVLRPSINPGYTVSPAPSITHASGGGSTVAPTASIKPSRTTTVPFSIGALDTGTMRALRIAKTCGPPALPACGAIMRASPMAVRTYLLVINSPLLHGRIMYA